MRPKEFLIQIMNFRERSLDVFKTVFQGRRSANEEQAGCE